MSLRDLDGLMGFPGGSVVKNHLPMQETQVRSLGWEDPLEKETGDPLQYSCLGNPIDRGAWWTTVPAAAKESHTTERLNHQATT